VRSRKTSELRAPVVEGHWSTVLVHMANISYRLGVPRSAAAAREAIQDQGAEALEGFDGVREHLEVNGVDFSKAEVVVGPWGELAPKTERFVGPADVVERANELARGRYRAPFVVPEQV